MQNAQTLLILGSRLNIRQVSYNWKAFASRAFKIQVDVDPAELVKPTVVPDLAVQCDLGVFLEELDRRLDSSEYDSSRHSAWLEWCKERRRRYPVVAAKYRTPDGPINPYHFADIVFQKLTGDDVVVSANASGCIIPFQVAHIKKGMRLFPELGIRFHGLRSPCGRGSCRGGEREAGDMFRR